MTNYYMNEAVFDLPDRPFEDKTIHGWDAKLPGGHTLGVLVHRREIAPGQHLRQLVDENIALNHKRLSLYQVLEQLEASIGGVPGRILKTSWRSERGPSLQLQAHVLFEGKWMIFAVTAPLDQRAVCEETFESLLSSLTWRTD